MSTPMHEVTTRIDAEDVPRVWNAVRDLSLELGNWRRWSQYPPTLSGWWGGTLLHLTYHNQLEPSVERAKVIGELLDFGMSSVANLRQPAFYSGMSGIGWGIEHISRAIGDECDLRDLDNNLLAVVARDPIRDHELIAGLAGIGFYGIERGRNGSEQARHLVTAVVRKLEADSCLQLDGVAWRKRAYYIPDMERERYPAGCWNLGLSHGTPGVIGFLTAAVKNDICADIAAHLVEQSVPWLMKQYYQIDACWHLASTVEGPRPQQTRLAWCYNELGACMPILDAAEVLSCDAWRAFAESVLESLAPLSLQESGVSGSNGVFDPAICHGIAGVTHLLAHGARRLNSGSLTRATRRWTTALLDSRSAVHGLCGFPRIGPPDKITNARPVESDAGFLEGASGVGLVLLGLLDAGEPGWNQILGI